MPKPCHRVLFNYDSSCLFDGTKEPITPRHVEQMVDEVAGNVDAILICAGDQRTVYPSEVWQTYWDGYKEGDRSFFGDVPEDSVPRREHWVRQMKRLAERCDYLDTALRRSRERGIAPGVTIRMNDMHDAPWPTSAQFSRFYKENPQWHLPRIEARSWGAGGLNYAHAEVREHFLSLIRELVARYDFDVLELDFMRFPYYFDRDDVGRHCETMTGFVREVRGILDGTGRSIALIPRVASSPGAARQLGFDVRAWARERIVDGITAANFLGTAWNLAIEAFRERVGPDLAVYAASEVAADRRDGLPVRYLPESYEMLRGLAAGYLAVGADGVNAFNYFLARDHQPVSAEEFYGGLREMRSLEEARNKPRIHVMTAGGVHSAVECDLPDQVPVLIAENKTRKFEMLLAAEGEGQTVEALVYFDGENGPDDLWLRIGLRSVGHAIEIRQGPEGATDNPDGRKSKTAVFNVPSGVIADGRNELILRGENVSTTVLGVDVCVR